jgi:hypothetical protein
VHLSDGGRGERLLVEGGKQLGRVGTEVLLEQFSHIGGVGGGNSVEQAAELP